MGSGGEMSNLIISYFGKGFLCGCESADSQKCMFFPLWTQRVSSRFPAACLCSMHPKPLTFLKNTRNLRNYFLLLGPSGVPSEREPKDGSAKWVRRVCDDRAREEWPLLGFIKTICEKGLTSLFSSTSSRCSLWSQSSETCWQWPYFSADTLRTGTS